MNTTARIEQIWVKRFHRGPMDAVSQATLQIGRGMVDNADQGGRRQLTIMSAHRWELVNKTLKKNLHPSVRRANILVSNMELQETRGRFIRLGPCLIRVLGETRPCEQMDKSFWGLQAALDKNWGGGAFAEVLTDGIITVGDRVIWEAADRTVT